MFVPGTSSPICAERELDIPVRWTYVAGEEKEGGGEFEAVLREQRACVLHLRQGLGFRVWV